MKIFTLNLQGNNNFQERKPKIIEVIQALKPDIVCFQEVIGNKETNIMEEMNEKLNFPYGFSAISHDYSKDYGKGKLQDEQVFEGLGVLSNMKFEGKKKDLYYEKGVDRWPRMALECMFECFTLTNVHLSKNIEPRQIEFGEIAGADILIGDFNAQKEEIESKFPEYKKLYNFRDYVSYPSKELLLDHFLIKKGEFRNLKTIEDLSDHNGILVEIDL